MSEWSTCSHGAMPDEGCEECERTIGRPHESPDCQCESCLVFDAGNALEDAGRALAESWQKIATFVAAVNRVSDPRKVIVEHCGTVLELVIPDDECECGESHGGDDDP